MINLIIILITFVYYNKYFPSYSAGDGYGETVLDKRG